MQANIDQQLTDLPDQETPALLDQVAFEQPDQPGQAQQSELNTP